MKEERDTIYSRIPELEKALDYTNNIISDIRVSERSIGSLLHRPIFIVGCGRSGTTLLYRFLANTGEFTYPTNILARFYKNPALGSYIQKILHDYDNGQIFTQAAQTGDYNSDLGKTIGPTAPSEFWYFWREYFKFGETHQLDENSLDSVDIKDFMSKLAEWEAVDNKPLLMKGMIMNWHLPYLYHHIPEAIFIYIKRDLVYTAQSILLARENFYNDRNGWWSFKPPEYAQLKDKGPIEQVVGQAYYTNLAVSKALKQLPSSNKVTIDYESFCSRPYAIIEELKNLGITTIDHDNMQDAKTTVFENRNQMKLNKEDQEKMHNILKKYNILG